MTTMLQPLAPWMRDLSRFMNTPGAASAFLPPADVLVSEDGERTLRVTDGLDPDAIEASMSGAAA
jgi:hypothetical protein